MVPTFVIYALEHNDLKIFSAVSPQVVRNENIVCPASL
jgi:hypothetical protein